ncbi:hypothetical protein RRF57_005485 [Xylaria bambusicola]|uniref:Uncharacterized protein n=1 Tax=Xylaria bambusicola TaxID=326684 RepID=A0AAN7UCQ2_9PEZI
MKTSAATHAVLFSSRVDDAAAREVGTDTTSVMDERVLVAALVAVTDPQQGPCTKALFILTTLQTTRPIPPLALQGTWSAWVSASMILRRKRLPIAPSNSPRHAVQQPFCGHDPSP